MLIYSLYATYEMLHVIHKKIIIWKAYLMESMQERMQTGLPYEDHTMVVLWFACIYCVVIL